MERSFFPTQTPRPRPDPQPRLPPVRRALTHLAALALLMVGLNVQAASIPIPNGDFSNTANQGTIGGGVIGGSGTAPIGTGPWSGSYFGALGLLAPPTLTIGSGQATIGGLLGVNVFGLIYNGGSFYQEVATPWQANKRYTLGADVTAVGVLDLAVLQGGNVGVALMRGSTRLASSLNPSAVTVTLVSGSTYHVDLVYETGASVSGNIGVQLFSEPSAALSVSLLTTVNYDNVTLTTRLLNQVPTSVVAVDATPRSTTVGGTINPPLTISVRDADGDPIQGVSVNFTVPSSGASATVVPNPAITDANGIAHVTVTANTIAGSYVILAEVAGVSPPISFPMTNLPGPASAVLGASGDAQSAVVDAPFAAPLVVQVTDAYGNAVPAVAVTFTAPANGASAIVPTTPVATGADGRAHITPVANTVAGSYAIAATVAGVTPSTAFDMTNLAGAASAVNGASGNGQSAAVGTPFAAPLVVQVADAYGNAVAGVPVAFTAPNSGASAAVPAGPVVTSADGTARITPVANTVAGGYQVSAAVAGVATPAAFSLTNQAGPATSIGATGGSRQATVVLTAFAAPLTVLVSDAHGNPVSGVAVSFVAPTSGASASVTSTVSTGADGRASATATANAVAGIYTVHAQATGVAAIPFTLTNLLDPAVDPIDVGTPEQTGAINSVFSCVLLVQVTHGDTPQAGLEVEFTAPASGPSATLFDGTNSGSELSVTTDEEGYAWVEATANEIGGSYVISAQLLYSLAPPIEFVMHNLDANEPVFNNGFDGLCIPPVGPLDLAEGQAKH